MKTIPKTPDLLPRLQSFDTFQSIDAAALQWLIDRSTYVLYEKGDLLFSPGMKVDHMQVIIEGEYVIQLERDGKTRELGVWGTGYITGVLPFSRMREAVANGSALRPTYVLELHRDCFTEMVNTSYELTQALVGVMSTRIRDFTQLRLQDEKLMALGKLSAGLAHELNNPASAMVRSSEELYKKIHATPEKFKSIMTLRVTPEQTDGVNAILFSRLQQMKDGGLSILEREERMDELIEWLEDHNMADADEIAETFVDFGLTIEELDRINDIIDGKGTGPILWWIESTLSLERLVNEIREAAGRIAELIKAVKTYSHMDRASTMEAVNLHEGLFSTVTILKHKIRNKQIQLVRTLDEQLPLVRGFAGELNQVWTNIIANAIEAMDAGGTLTIQSFQERDMACIDISDTGSGIPQENLGRIFDPFFTTKPLGEGTGLGLDIVKKIIDRHNGYIRVQETRPGKTTFRICLPIDK